MKKLITITTLLLCTGALFAQPTVNIVPYANGFTNGITTITNAGTSDSRLFVVEQLGYVSIIDSAGNTLPNFFLDIHNKVTDNVFTVGDEQGLLGLAFSPQFAQNGFVYVNYTDKNGIGNTVISRFKVDSLNPNMVDTSSEEVLLYIQQPYSNHNGGDLKFGPDGYLYIALGDGGSAGDPQNRAQNPDSLLGKLLRIDVSDSTGYSIPPTNPFAGGGGRPEIWAWGLRNPWRFSFDRDNGNLWIADVGQNAWEEINFQSAASTGGENYGWRCYEGTHPYNTAGCSSTPGVYTLPAYEYSQSATGGCAVVGGYVYRGVDYPDLTGYYFYSDYCSGDIYTLSSTFTQALAGSFSGSFTTFGENAAGELFIGNQINGIVYRIVSTMTGIETLSKDLTGIELYPNPNHGNFTCELESKEALLAGIEIVDIAGRVCYSNTQKMTAGFNTFTINLGGIQSGSYRMKISTDNGVVYEKFEIIK